MELKEEFKEQENTTQRYELLVELGDCYTSLGQYEKARPCFEQAAQLSPDDAYPYVGLGIIHLQQDVLDEAELSFKVALRLDRACSQAYAGLAMIAQQRNHYQQAFEMYLGSLELDPDNMTALLGLFQVSCHTGSFDKVTHYLDVYLNAHPGDVSVMFTLAALYKKDNRLEEAKTMLDDILILEPSNQDAANLLEEVHRDLKDPNLTTEACRW